MRRRSRPLAVAALAPALLAACSLAPEYQAPATPAVTAFKESGAWQPAVPADAVARGDWWTAFGDPDLDALQQRLSVSSQDLRAALARYEQALAIAGQSRSALYPSVDAGVAATRARSSGNAPGASGVPITSNNLVASLSLSWEIDLLGRLSNAVAANERRAEASQGQLAALELGLRAQLASAYMQLRGTDAAIALYADSVTAYERALDLTRRRYAGGIAAAADVAQAETQLQSTQAQLAAAQLRRAQYEHAIAVLIGEPASTFTLAPGRFNAEPPPFPAGLPSTLLERRPDVAAAERAVAAANAGIGIARAAWFPVFTFGASAGYRATQAGDWFDAPSGLWSLGPSIVAPVLDAGRRSSLNRQALATHEEAAARYRSTVLVAYQEVEDSLAALHWLADEASRNAAAAEAAQRALFHANQRYAAGVADYLEVTTTQTAALTLQRAALDARVRRVVAGIGLVRATGGGWSRADLDLGRQ